MAQAQLTLAIALGRRSTFIAKYPVSLDSPGFVDALLVKVAKAIGVNLASQGAGLINLYSQVRQLIPSNSNSSRNHTSCANVIGGQQRTVYSLHHCKS